MEVLMSIGVVTIGLMGVAALLPVAFQQAESGARNDRMAMVGRRAFREMHTRGLLRTHFELLDIYGTPGDLTDDVSAPLLSRACEVELDPVRFNRPTLQGPSGYRRAFLIDARGILGGWDASVIDHRTFPAVSTHSPDGTSGLPRGFRMTRVGLTPSDNVVNTISIAKAERLFVVEDDLEFEPPESNAELPRQTMIDVANTAIKRAATGNMSWIASVVPEATSSDVYRVSVAVSFQRNSPFQADITRRITSIYGGIGGGDIEMELGPTPTEMRPGQWLMIVIAPATGAAPLYRWYRVVSASDEIDLDTDRVPDVEVVSLQGPNIPAFGYKDAFGNNNHDLAMSTAGGGGGYRYFAVLMPSVVAVYEKTMRLENDSVWSY